MMSLIRKLLVVFVSCLPCLIYAQKAEKVKADEVYQRALAEVKEQHVDKAVSLLKQAILLYNEHVDAKVLLAKLFYNTKRYDDAMNIASDVIIHFPKYRDIYYYAVGSALSKGEAERALTFTNNALKIFLNDKEFSIKKLAILDLLFRFPEGDLLANYLYKLYWLDNGVQVACSAHYQAKAGWFLKTGKDPVLAKGSYEMSLKINPENVEARLGLEKMLNGSNELMLAHINDELSKNNRSYDLLMHKLGLLQELKRYAEALEVLEVILKYFPTDAKAQLLNKTLRNEAAEFYQKTNYYTLYQSVLDRDPNNREALRKVIGIAIDRGDNKAALVYVNQALKREPGDIELLSKKLDLEFDARNYVEASKVASLVYFRKPSSKLKLYIMDVIAASGRYYLGQEQPDSAIAEFNRVLVLDSANFEAYRGIITAYSMLNDREMVIKELDKALSLFPGNKELMIKKAGFLAQYGVVVKASNLSDSLSREMPDDKRVQAMYLEQKLAAATAAMVDEDYQEAAVYLHDVLAKQPDNQVALNYMINMLDATGRYEEALHVSERSLAFYPDDKALLLKKTSLLYNLRRYGASAEVARKLYEHYPYSSKIKAALTNALFEAAQLYGKSKIIDSAIYFYNSLLEINPQDTLAALNKSAILASKQNYIEAISVLDKAIENTGKKESFIVKKAFLLESLGRFKDAAVIADTLQKLYPSEKYLDYYKMLKAQTYKNQIGVNFLHTSFDENGTRPYSYGTLSATKFFDKGSYGGTLTFAGRQQGNGLEAAFQLNYKHRADIYSVASISIGNGIVLPKYRVLYSLVRTLPHLWDVELGGRFVDLDSLRSYTIVAAAAKRVGSLWFNLRGYGINEQNSLKLVGQKRHFYTACNFTSRYYSNNDRDFLAFIAGVGTSPDDIGRLVLYPSLGGLLSKTVGFGYQKAIDYNSAFNITGSWTNLKVAPSSFLNQYDIYIGFVTKF